jgi:hypothetical protein
MSNSGGVKNSARLELLRHRYLSDSHICHIEIIGTS